MITLNSEKYMCMIGQLQWAVTLGRYDILAHVMSMSRFRLAPKNGHLERLKRPVQEQDWSRSVIWKCQRRNHKRHSQTAGE